jgi:hypothetical protein
MNQDSLKKFIEKVDKIIAILGEENGDVIKTNLVSAVFVDFRTKFLDKNANSQFFNQLSKTSDNAEFGNKLNEMGLNSVEDFDSSCDTTLKDFLAELSPKLTPAQSESIGQIIKNQ